MKNKIRGGVMQFDLFKHIYEHICTSNMIDSETDIGLFNWGEPFMNPDLEKICSFLSTRNQPFHLSTNASIYKPIVKSMSTLTSMTFSMCGFSQQSYNRIHGFNFNKVVDNIQKYVRDFGKYRYKSNLYIAYHIYQFNEDEIKAAYCFARELGIGIHFSYAYLNGISLGLDYMNNSLSYNFLKQMGKDINLGYLDQLLTKRKEAEACEEMHRLVIDEEGKVLMCCCADKQCDKYSLDEIFAYSSFEEIDIKRRKLVDNLYICRKCLDSGLHYWMHNSPIREVKGNIIMELVYKGKNEFRSIRQNYKKIFRQ